METSQSLAEFSKAFAKMQGELKAVPKDSVNPFFHSKYADLATVVESSKAALTKNGFGVSQCLEGDGENASVTTMLIHTSGEWIRSTAKIKPVKNDPQGVGSAITYLRRYALAAILGLASEEDDDGNEATNPKEKARQVEQPSLVDRITKAINEAKTETKLNEIHLAMTDKASEGKLTKDEQEFVAAQIKKRREKLLKEAVNV